ncbi:MAG: GIY-YIG nuclease family protein [Christensenellales bacterium]|jgi:putative endonuclease
MPFAYMVRCADGSYYSGSAVNMKKRIDAHNAGAGAKYTRSRRPVRLVYYEEFQSLSDAMKREAALKKLSHAQKVELARNFEKAGLDVLL